MYLTLSLLYFISSVVAHGTVSGIVADGIFYEGYNPSYQYISLAPITVGWKIPEDLDNGFVAPSAYQTSDIICHIAATNAMIEAPMKGGGVVELQWTPWPISHHGPVIDYLANCNGPCETVDKTTLKWFKIDAVGLLNPAVTDGYWATDVLIANNNSWTVEIPPSISTGNYVLRHEIIALHAVNSFGGAQNYPQCVSLAITSSGTANPSGTLVTTFCSETDPGTYIDIYATLTNYTIPGPALYNGAVTLSQTLPPTPTASSPGISSVA